MWKYAKQVTRSMKSKYVNGTIVTIFRENVLIMATYWQLDVCDNFDYFFVTILILAIYWQRACDRNIWWLLNSMWKHYGEHASHTFTLEQY